MANCGYSLVEWKSFVWDIMHNICTTWEMFCLPCFRAVATILGICICYGSVFSVVREGCWWWGSRHRFRRARRRLLWRGLNGQWPRSRAVPCSVLWWVLVAIVYQCYLGIWNYCCCVGNFCSNQTSLILNSGGVPSCLEKKDSISIQKFKK